MDREPAPAATVPEAAFWELLGWQPTPEQLDQLVALQQELRRWNQRLNLTRLVEGDDYWIAQVFDSLWPHRALLAASGSGSEQPGQAPAGLEPPGLDRPGLELIDVGTGGGFPGLALAIALPEARLTLVDSVGRKVEAVAQMARALGLESRVSVRCERIERTGRTRGCRGRFQLAVARAVAAAPVVAEYLVPLLATDGQAVLYRGQWPPDDAAALERALVPLRARLERLERIELPAGRGVRHAVVVVPTAPCPATYPRAVGVPSRVPLG
ncbi:MAG: 16S rRNA (guanine(527)-N(7))-methyltransferase RsmG [Cyanobacteriota bacterium]|nr:16S rRNA (guanine(527)-N(7))-methyltransferase RsmG [Cyanobacteriota bacterium]